MASADGSVVIEVDIDPSEADKELARLKKKILHAEESLTVKKHEKSALTQQLQDAQKELDALQKRVTISGGKFLYGEGDIERIAELKGNISQLTGEIDKSNKSIERTNILLEGERVRYGEVAQGAVRAQSRAADTSAMEQAEAKMTSILERMKTALKGSADGLKGGLDGIADGFKGMAEKAASAAKGLIKSIPGKIADCFKGIAKYAGKAAKSIISLFKGSKNINGSFSSGLKTMLKYGLGIRSLFVLFNRLRSAVTDGFKNLALFSSETNSSISMLKSALTQLKNSLATAFAPILTAVAPIITQFINMVSRAADAVARLMSMLAGKSSYTRAISVQEDYAKSLEGTGSAAEDAAGSLAGFDEINTIATQDASKASGAGAAAAPSEMFEEVAIEPLSFDSWGEAFSAMLDKLLNVGIPKLKDAFSGLAAWLNGFSANLYEMLTFPGVYDKVAALGSELASALNGLVNQIDWTTLGGALGAGLNLALGFLVSFIYTFDWINLGASLATMFNNAVAKIDWYNVGMLLWAKFKIALETLAGFLLNTDMEQLGQAAANLVTGFFDSASETLQKIDWQALGNQAALLLASIDWNVVSNSVFEALGSAFGAAAGFLWGLIEDAWNDVVDWWHEAAFEDGQFTFQGLLDGIVDVVTGIGEWIMEHIVDPFIEGFKKAFGIASPSKVMAEQGGFLMQGLLQGIQDTLQPVLDIFDNLKQSIEQILGGIVQFVSGVFTGDWEEAWEGVKNIFKGIWNGIVGTLEGAVNLVITGINWLISQLNKVSFTLPDWVPEIGGKRFGFNIPPISEVQIPRLATGAVIPPNREFMAVLGDQQRGNNIEAPEALIRKIVREESGSRDTQILEAILDAIKAGHIIMVDGTALGRTAIKSINNLTASAGRTLLKV